MMLLTHVVPSSPTIIRPGRLNAKSARGGVSPRVRRCLEGISLWFAVLLFLFVQPLYAEASETGREGTGEFYFMDDDGQRRGPATLLDTDYRVTVSGLIADTRLRQSFRNTSQQWREGVFVFPLPENASVYGMTMTAGERVVVGDIHEKQEAKRQYTRAKEEGRKVARVDQQRPNLFTTRMANIPPGETITVELNYQQAVRYQSGAFELRLPTTLTPRYMPGQVADNRPVQWTGGWASPTTEVPDADQISPFTVLPGDVVAPASHRATIALEINAGLPVSSVSSPSHRINSTWNGNGVEVAPESGEVLMERDLVVRWASAKGMEPSAAVFHERWQGEDYLLALMVPGVNHDQRMPRELLFVIDTSGSMAGESIRQARQALLRGLETLGPDDRFNVIQFNSQTHTLYMEPVPASANNIARARRYVQGLNANGGTEMAPALDAALKDSYSDRVESARVRQVVFITDGSVGNEAALFGKIRSQLGRSRLFTVGIGSAPNMHFMREAARFGRGTYTAISDLSEVERPLEELLAKMESPVLTDISVSWPGQTAATEAFPGRIGDLFRGEPMVQVVRGLPGEGELEVSGRLADGEQWQQSLRLDQAAPGKGLHRHWAKQKISGLMDSGLTGRIDDDTRGEVADLGLKHQLMTKYTSFVAQEKTPSRPADETLATDSIPTLLPAGSQGTMLRYPQTATLSPLLIAIGLVGLMFSAAITLLQRRVFA